MEEQAAEVDGGQKRGHSTREKRHKMEEDQVKHLFVMLANTLPAIWGYLKGLG